VALSWKTASQKGVQTFPLSRHVFLEGWREPYIVPPERENMKAEFRVLLAVTKALPLHAPPDEAANQILQAIASQLGVDYAEISWREATKDYREVLIRHFEVLQSHAPRWLMGSPETPSPLLVGDCVPTVEIIQKLGVQGAINSLPKLSDWIDKVRHNVGEWHKHYCAQVIECLRGMIGELDGIEGDRRAMEDALRPVLVGKHNELEARVFSNAQTVENHPFPGGEMDISQARHLLQLLDEYESTVQSIIFPHRRDPNILKVCTSVPLSEAADLPLPEVTKSPSDRFREKIIQTVKEVRRSEDSWQTSKSEARSWNPADFLCDLILRVVPSIRLTEIQASLQAPDVQMSVRRAVQEDRVSEILDSLNVEELVAIETVAISETGGRNEILGATKEALYDSIKANVGLLPNSAATARSKSKDAADALSKKIEASEFDVFLAHNSVDKEKVLKLGEMLRLEGINPWIDIEQIPPGRWFQDIIQSALRRVKTAAIVIGASGIGRWQALELRGFISRCVEASLPVIPVLLPGAECLPEDLIFLRELNYVKFRSEVTEREGIQMLAWGIIGKKCEG
jgi:TIR domain